MAASTLAVTLALAAPDPIPAFAQSPAIETRDLLDRVSRYVQAY